MAEKFLKSVSGQTTEKEVITTSAGAGDAGKIVGLDGSGRFDSSMMPAGFGMETTTADATEDLAAGEFVNIYDATGLKCRLADAAGGNAKKADGYVLANVTSGQTATIYYGNLNNQLSGGTVGATIYLSDTPGAVTETAPSGTGVIVQQLGKMISATEAIIEIQGTITLA